MAEETLGIAKVPIRAALEELDKDLEKAKEKIDQGLSKAMKTVGDKMTKVGKNLTMKVTAPLVGLGFLAVREAGNFEEATNVLAIAARSSGTAMEDLRGAAIAVGKDTQLVGIDAMQAADAMTTFYKAGLKTGDIFTDLQGYLEGTVPLTGALRSAIDLAAASDLDLAAASEVVAVAMATFGLSAEDAARIADSFVGAADASVAEVGDLVQGMVNVGPTAAQFGYSLEDVNTALAILSTRGIVGAEAGTALKSMMTNIMRPTKDVREALAELNISLYDQEGRLKALPTLIGELSDALYGQVTVTEEVGGPTKEQTKLLKDYQGEIAGAQKALEEYEAGVRGVGQSDKTRGRNIEQLRNKIGFYTDKINAMEIAQSQTISSTRDLTDEQRNQYIQTLAGTYGMKAMATLLGEGRTGWDDMTQGIADAASAEEVAAARTKGFNAAMEQLQGAWQTFMIVAGTPLIEKVLMPLVGKLQELMEWAIELDPEILQLALVFAGVVAAVGPLLLVLGTVASGIGTIIPIVGALLGPLGLVIAVIALLAAAWIGNWGGIRDTLTAVWEGTIRPALERLGVWLGETIPKVFEFLRNTWETVLLPALQSLGAWLGETIPKVIEFLRAAWEDVLLPALRAVWGFLDEYVIPILKALANLWLASAKKALEMIAAAWTNKVYPALKDLWDWLGKVVAVIGEKLQPLFDWLKDEALPVIGEALEAVGKAVKDLIGYWNDLADAVDKLPIPDILKPGSPTPFELGIRGISDALAELARVEMPRLQAELDLRPMMARGQLGAGGGGRYITVTIGTIHAPGGQVEQVREGARLGVQEGLKAVGLA